MKFQAETASLRGADAQLFAFFCPSRVTSRANIEETQYPIYTNGQKTNGIPDLQKIIIEWQYNFCRTQLFVGLRIASDVPEDLAAQRAWFYSIDILLFYHSTFI